MATEARRLAAATLVAIDRGQSALGELLARPEVEALEQRERDFLHELVLGSLRRRGAIDAALRPASSRPLAELTPEVLAALRLSAHEILHLRTARHAAVHEGVELVRALAARASGFANAVLRRVSESGPPAAPDRAAEPLAWLRQEGSLPDWLALRWARRLGPEAACRRASALLEPPPVFFRLHPRRDAAARLATLGVSYEDAGVPGALRLVSGRLQPAVAEGLVYVQDQGSQAVAQLALSHGRLLDACAAPGGKSLLLSDLCGAGAIVVALERAPRRLPSLAHLVRGWQASNVRVVRGDAGRPPFAAPFDAILLDAPCSGLGTLARNPDLRWRSRPGDPERQAQRQRRLLEALAPLVRPGGLLVYAVCSLEPEENEAVVEPFLAARADFALAALPEWAAAFADGPYLRTRPESQGGDGFFAARLRRQL
ncbi:MAG: RsmB/NOP family class I SAM-dependent RNA methyltransferase [Vicinamibacteria bacterium]